MSHDGRRAMRKALRAAILLLTMVTSILGAAHASAAVVGGVTETLSAAELEARREALRQYFAKRRERLHIVATTRTESGQVIDWIPRDSQYPGKYIATPPPSDKAALAMAKGEGLVPFELAYQPAARGPKGTVPVLRQDLKEVLARIDPPARVEDFLTKYGHAYVEDPIPAPGLPGHKYASTKQNTDNVGGQAYISLWNPDTPHAAEFSLAQVAVVRTRGNGVRQTVETGWQKARSSYGDDVPHLFIYYTTVGYAHAGDLVGGYNDMVDGWVQYSALIFPGALLSPMSQYNGDQYAIHVQVALYMGNWWIGVNDEWMGYYPAALFAVDGLLHSAESIAWYGEVADFDDGVASETDMGSGHFASEGWRKAAYMRDIWYYDVYPGTPWSYFPDEVWASDSSHCYSIDGHFVMGSVLLYDGPVPLDPVWQNIVTCGGDFSQFGQSIPRFCPPPPGLDPSAPVDYTSYFYFGGPGRNANCP